MTTLRIMVSRHSAFYSPVLAGITAGFFKDEGFEPTYAVAPPGRTVAQLIASGEIDVAQSAVSASWIALEQGRPPPMVHFAQINQRDGFLIAARSADLGFQWDKLLTGRFMFVHGGQPQAMLAYAMHLRGVNLSQAQGMDRGGTDQMLGAFRAGEGDWFHEQAPYPQQLEHEGVAHIVASVGEVIGPVAFSSVAASREWLARPEARRFIRAYRKARAWVDSAAPAEVAASEQPMFPGTHRDALTRAIAYYQALGNWGGGVSIAPEAYEVALDVFSHSKLITRRHPYDKVVVAPPDA
ncbi:MAG TPA: ABC transporter substrate-binding protein [Burkholderiales bacterium]|nr:ABC transporter substrate-binding protein [Burkholderiales bacterium]